ncbi:conjugative transposon protein TraM, partial [Bacteroides fragilis]
TVAACIHQDQTLTDGQAVKLRLLEPMQAGNIVVTASRMRWRCRLSGKRPFRDCGSP